MFAGSLGSGYWHILNCPCISSNMTHNMTQFIFDFAWRPYLLYYLNIVSHCDFTLLFAEFYELLTSSTNITDTAHFITTRYVTVKKQWMYWWIKGVTIAYHIYHPPTKLEEGNVFTGVCQPVGGGGVRMMHCTGSPNPPPKTWDLTLQPPPLALSPSRHGFSLYRAPFQSWHLLVTSGGNHWRPVQTSGSPMLTSVGYWGNYVWCKRAVASYWSAFLLLYSFTWNKH